MTDQELRDLVAELVKSQAKTDEQMKRTDEKFEELRISNRKTDEKFEELRISNKKMGQLLGSISNNQGDVAEEFFYNSLEHKKDLAGIHYDYVGKNLKNIENNLQDEFDIVMVNGKDVAIIEVKYKAHEKDLKKLLTTKQENFKILFPKYKDYTHHLGLASFHMNEDLKNEALDAGVIVLQRKGDTIETFVKA